MKQFIGTKEVLAKRMTLGEYNDYRSWTMPENEDPAKAGFLVEYLDGEGPNDPRHTGYISWTPDGPFLRAYCGSGEMSFGHALVAMQAGRRVARAGWNGKGMFIYIVPAAAYPAQRGAAKRWAGEDAMIDYRAYIAMKTVNDEVVPWVISQSDALENDWFIIEDDIAQPAAEAA